MAPILMTPGNWFESDGSDANVATTARIAIAISCNSLFLRRRQIDFLDVNRVLSFFIIRRTQDVFFEVSTTSQAKSPFLML